MVKYVITVNKKQISWIYGLPEIFKRFGKWYILIYKNDYIIYVAFCELLVFWILEIWNKNEVETSMWKLPNDHYFVLQSFNMFQVST